MKLELVALDVNAYPNYITLAMDAVVADALEDVKYELYHEGRKALYDLACDLQALYREGLEARVIMIYGSEDEQTKGIELVDMIARNVLEYHEGYLFEYAY